MVSHEGYFLKHKGIGGRIKKEKVRSLVRREKPDLVVLQETKLASVDAVTCQYLWGGQVVNWVSSPALGNSSGLLTLWDSKVFSLKLFFSGNGFLGVTGLWCKNNLECIIVNIYSSGLFLEKRNFGVIW